MRWLTSSVLLLLAGLVEVRATVPTHYADAPLRAVHFVDRTEGWAVGDEGTIWHSIDGGQTWERQASGTRASLRSICFLTPYTGWIVGRLEQPFGQSSLGVVLHTTDGGLTWKQRSFGTLPGLNTVRFFDEHHGIAAGDSSDAAPSGVFRTTDGGSTWKPIPGPRCPSWLAADFSDPNTAALAGVWSRLAVLRQGQFTAADVDTLGGRSVHGLKLLGQQRAIAVGDGGLILTSAQSAGVKWGFSEPKLPKETLACLDFHAVATHGKHCWVVGRPGSVIFHSADFGQTWEMQPTLVTVPLHAVYFVTVDEGWAVGEQGTILATTDGGKTWRTQKLGGQRAAALFVHAEARSLPLDTVAYLGHEHGYLTTALRWTCADPASAAPARAQEAARLAQAMRQTGGASAETLWHFPLPDTGSTSDPKAWLNYWNDRHSDSAAQQVLRQLVLAIRLWRPEVIVTEPLPREGLPGDPLQRLTVEATQQAFRLAADEQAFPEQFALGLKPWTVKKLYALSEAKADSLGTLDLTTTRPRIGNDLRGFAWRSTRLLDAQVELPTLRAFRLLATRLSAASDEPDLLAGLDLAPGGSARRALPALRDADADAVAALDKTLRKRRHLEALAKPTCSELTSPQQLLAQIAPTLKELPADMAAQAAHTLAEGFVRTGQWPLAREVFLLLVERHPSHPLSAEAYRWLVRYQSSSEAKRRQELGQFLVESTASFQPVDANASNSDAPIRGGVQLVEHATKSFLHDPIAARAWYQGALEMESKLAGFGRLYVEDAAVQLCLNSARRRLHQWEAAKQWYNHYLAQTAHSNGPFDPWRDCVATELWLTNRASSPTPVKPIGVCRATEHRPMLDGQLNDACWQNLAPLLLKDATGRTSKDYATQAKLAHDKDFLYIAIECRHPAGHQVPKVEKRSRDADLRGYDRVDLLIDLDRDYQTYYRFQVDQRGCVAEDCWGDASWNPRWFVALKSEPTGWTAEMAIPLVELSGEVPTAGKVWALNVVRVLPQRGVLGFSLPAENTPRPEGMGLLQFTQPLK